MSAFHELRVAHIAALMPKHREWLDPLDFAIIETRAHVLALQDLHGSDYQPPPQDVWRLLQHRAGFKVRLDPALRHHLPPDLRALLFP